MRQLWNTLPLECSNLTAAGLIHPETGQLLETHEEVVSAIAEIEERFAPLYRVRRALREGLTEFEAVLPPARSRTPTQDRVARCPRCGGLLEDS